MIWKVNTVNPILSISSNNYIVDAFVALGGKYDKTGTVKKEAIVNLIQGEFELTYDVEKLIASFVIEGEELDFQTFCLFCEGAGGEKKNKKNNLAMAMNNKGPIRMNSNGSFVVRFEDFEKYATVVRIILQYHMLISF